MKKNFLYLIIFLFALHGCASFEFVYNDNIKNNILDKKTAFNISGDDDTIIKIEIKNLIKESNPNKEDFVLSIKSEKKTKNLVVEDNQVASQVEIIHTIKYELFSVVKACNIDRRKVVTIGEYNIKSSGYDFGSDISKNNIIKDNITKNVNEYLNFLDFSLDQLRCV